MVPSSSLVPANDPTLLFVNAGMVQFKDVFLGAEKRDYKRAVSSQRCVRAGGKHNDLDQVGYTARHHTFFEMLGNFSFGDYFKREAIEYAWEFLTGVLELPAERLWVTVFEEDDEAEAIWINDIGVPADRVTRIGAKDNFWQMGDTGPCGPCTEIFYDHGEGIEGGPPGTPEEDGDRYIEIWNLVFMQFDRQADGSLVNLPNPCVDTGMGLERIASILQGQHNNYDIDLFQALVRAAAEFTRCTDLSSPSLKVIADHIRTCAFLICDGVLPSNEGRGYVLRRIVRRALRHGHKLGANWLFFYKMVAPLIEQMGEAYPELLKQRSAIESALKQEETKFSETLDAGMQEFNRQLKHVQGDCIPGDVAFKLYDTFGFPLDLTQDVAREMQLSVDVAGFDECMKAQQARSRAGGQFVQGLNLPADLISRLEATEFTGYLHKHNQASVQALVHEGEARHSMKAGEQGWVVLDKTPFYAESGGQVGDIGWFESSSVKARVLDTQKAAGQYHVHLTHVLNGELSIGDAVEAVIDVEHRQKVVLNHSATHLLHKVLRDVLGDHVGQKGSLVNADKLRFDFSHPAAIDKDVLQQIERDVNRAIRNNYTADVKIMSYDDAIDRGAVALFGEKYGDRVRVLDLGGYSVELCGGTHVESAGDIGFFKILSESSVSSGVRRIEAVTGDTALRYVQSQDDMLSRAARLVNTTGDTLDSGVAGLIDKNKTLEKKLKALQKQQMSGTASGDEPVRTVHGVPVLSQIFDNADIGQMRDRVDGFKGQHADGVAVLASVNDGGKVHVLVGVGKARIDHVRAGDLIKEILGQIGGRGGGRPDFAQGGGEADKAEIEKAVNAALEKLQR